MSSLAELFDTPGVGGAVAMTAVVILVVCYGLTVRWIAKGGEETSDEE